MTVREITSQRIYTGRVVVHESGSVQRVPDGASYSGFLLDGDEYGVCEISIRPIKAGR